ncbi:MAG: adenylate/guanylate cyclase domain-containing protein [Halobacteriovoraceae bacterium]|nr:adenylate/guanylate cyclase domain-containing protein [Halobacteriovoraceae bacterium]
MRGLRLPIFAKITILSFILLGVIGGVTAWQSSTFYEEMSSQREEFNSLSLTTSKLDQVEGIINNHIDKMRLFAIESIREDQSVNEELPATDSFDFEKDLLYLVVKEHKFGSFESLKDKFNHRLAKDNGLELEDINDVLFRNNVKDVDTLTGKVSIINASNEVKKAPLLRIDFPILKEKKTGNYRHIVTAIIYMGQLKKAFKIEGPIQMFLVDGNGRVIGDKNEENVVKNAKFPYTKLYQEASEAKIKIKQKYVTMSDSKEYISTHAKGLSDLVLFTLTPKNLIKAPAQFVKSYTFFTLGIILSVSFFVIFIFSTGLTRPIEKLVEITKKIAAGNFDIEVENVVSANDEIGELAKSFDLMLEGLKERDKIKNMFSKFHGSSVAEEILSNPLNREGEKKEVVIFFSDIRGFTDYSENNSPEEVVNMLNAYFEIMVGIINEYGGVVDKFVGDAIMAVWGVPKSHEADCQNAVSACLKMRIELAKFNHLRISTKRNPIIMGMGLHYGEVVSGTIGSNERMEYTVIGDVVNTASRIESSTKAHGTDFLVSERIFQKTEKNFIFEKVGDTSVKGKKEALKTYKVLGYYDQNRNPQKVETKYSSYQSSQTDKVKLGA